jgi:hypothetical protein
MRALNVSRSQKKMARRHWLSGRSWCLHPNDKNKQPNAIRTEDDLLIG